MLFEEKVKLGFGFRVSGTGGFGRYTGVYQRVWFYSGFRRETPNLGT
jgi:hypothetical protein